MRSLLPIFLAGATATGKSAVALALAESLPGEIISVDSMQVYQGMDVGTAKPSPDDRSRVPHHGIDVCPLTESFDAARFVALASAVAEGIQARGRTPIFCGGTGFYFKAYLQGLGDSPPGDPLLRARLQGEPLETLLAELQNRDPEAWARIDRFNRRRVERAVEVLRLTGRRESERRRWDPGGGSGSDLVVVVLRRDPADLRRRIEARVDAMFARGLVEETRGLLARGLRANRVACQALGYRQAIEHLDGARSLAETVELVKRKTWQFARRQATWFRHQLPVTWLDVAEHETPAAMAARIPRPPGMTLTGSAAGEPPQSG